MKKALLLVFFLGHLLNVYSQSRPQWTFTPSLGLGYKLSDWLYGSPLCLSAQGQATIKDKVLLESWMHITSFKDVVFKDQKFSRLFGSIRVRHSSYVMALGIGYHANLPKKSHLQISGGAVWVNYQEPYLQTTNNILLSGYKLDSYPHNSAGLYGKIQYNIFLNDHLYFSLGSTALTSRYLSYGIVHTGCTFWFPHK